MLIRILTSAAVVSALGGAMVSPVIADSRVPGTASEPRVVAPAPGFQIVPRPTQQPGGAVDQLFGILDPVEPPSGPGQFSSAGAGLDDTQYCCDANDNCGPLPLPGVCPPGTITTWCDDDGNCEDEDDE